MGREVRRVPANWEHPKMSTDPKDEIPSAFKKLDGDRIKYRPLLEGHFSKRLAEWNLGKAKWDEGFRENWGAEPKWVPIEEKYRSETYEEWDGEQPKVEDYMPEWPAELYTHYQMYETCTEGTPISPVLATPEELAQWLTDNEASAFGDMTATYEQWLKVCKGAWAPSAVVTMTEEGSIIKPGVAL